jgi:release factor glutamine methyltransferase
VALLSELPAAFGIGVDISAPALAVARENARANGVGDRAGFVVGNWTAALADGSKGGGFDLIVANPPYIPTSDCAGLARDVAAFDPVAALDGGTDGLDAYRAILADAARVLAPSGGLVLELGIGQRGAVATLAAERGLAVGATQHDLNEIERAIVLTLSCV